jgi:DNA mismatch endonuclease (patch repair protein)
MPDVFTKAKRSQVMSRIRGRGNRATELALMRIFRADGITGWRRHISLSVDQRKPEKKLRVRPDFVFPRLKLAVFVDGCFWHSCSKHATKPKNNAVFWRRKLAANKARDQLVTRLLRKNGWQVLRLWEHDLTGKRHLRVLTRIRKAQTRS